MNTLMNITKKFLVAGVLLGYSVVSIVGLVHVAQMHVEHTPVHDCPFEQGGNSMCQMSVIEHIKSWQQFSSTLIPSTNLTIQLSLALLFFAIVLISFSTLPDLIYLKRKKYLYNFSLFKLLFYKNILNPRAP